jgi:hypothetical protein
MKKLRIREEDTEVEVEEITTMMEVNQDNTEAATEVTEEIEVTEAVTEETEEIEEAEPDQQPQEKERNSPKVNK